MDTPPTRTFPPLWLPVLVILLAGSFYIVGKRIEARGYQPTTITVQAEGKATAAPDIALLEFGVQTGRVKTAEEATTKLSEAMNAAIAAVKDQGVEEKDIQTRALSISPSYDWNEGIRIDRGFEATEMLSVKVRDLSKIGEILSAAVSAGANQTGGVNFTMDDPEALKTQAREEAIGKAQQQAALLADQLGMRLGALKNFSEGGGVVAPMYARAEAMDVAVEGGAVPPVPVPAGEQDVLVTVYMVYELQ